MKRGENIAMEQLVTLQVHLRDLMTGTDLSYWDPTAWIAEHENVLYRAVDTFMNTFGGTIMISGTPEVGRVTVYPTTSSETPILDMDWHTYSFPAR